MISVPTWAAASCRTSCGFTGIYRKRLSKSSQPGLVQNAGPDGIYLTGDEPAAFPKLTGQNIDGKLHIR